MLFQGSHFHLLTIFLLLVLGVCRWCLWALHAPCCGSFSFIPSNTSRIGGDQPHAFYCAVDRPGFTKEMKWRTGFFRFLGSFPHRLTISFPFISPPSVAMSKKRRSLYILCWASFSGIVLWANVVHFLLMLTGSSNLSPQSNLLLKVFVSSFLWQGAVRSSKPPPAPARWVKSLRQPLTT